MNDDNWVIEEANPDVGIFGDSVIHVCEANDDYAEATTEVSMRADEDPRMVRVTTTFTCPVDNATTEVVEQMPAEWFAEPGR